MIAKAPLSKKLWPFVLVLRRPPVGAIMASGSFGEENGHFVPREGHSECGALDEDAPSTSDKDMLRAILPFELFICKHLEFECNLDAENTQIVLVSNCKHEFSYYNGLYGTNSLSGCRLRYVRPNHVSTKNEVAWVPRRASRGPIHMSCGVKLLKQFPEEYPYKDDE
ncbi:hypothetical protein NL676_024259 [Syzygium grande]|nr:hypothetical protein NL676_024259 [Syzygium grande]